MSSGTSFRSDVHLHGEQSGGALAVIENTMPGGAPGPPLHRHDFDEAFYVLEGELTFKLGDDVFTRRAGELAFAPRGVPHTFDGAGWRRRRRRGGWVRQPPSVSTSPRPQRPPTKEAR